MTAHQLAQRGAVEIDPDDSLRVYAVPRAMLAHCRTYGALTIMEPHDYWLL